MLISEFLNNFNGGTRVNRFVVETHDGIVGAAQIAKNNPIDSSQNAEAASTLLGSNSLRSVSGGLSFPFHIRSTKIPELTMGVIPVNYRGKTVYFPGDRALADWEIIVIDDVSKRAPQIGGGFESNTHLHKAFIEWSNAICNLDSSLGVQDFWNATRWNTAGGNRWKIRQYDIQPTTLSGTDTPSTTRLFEMYNCWPKEVGPLQFSMDSNNTVNYFRVVMAYTHTKSFDTTNSAQNW